MCSFRMSGGGAKDENDFGNHESGCGTSQRMNAERVLSENKRAG